MLRLIRRNGKCWLQIHCFWKKFTAQESKCYPNGGQYRRSAFVNFCFHSLFNSWIEVAIKIWIEIIKIYNYYYCYYYYHYYPCLIWRHSIIGTRHAQKSKLHILFHLTLYVPSHRERSIHNISSLEGTYSLRLFPSFALRIPTVHDFCVVSACAYKTYETSLKLSSKAR